MGFFMIGLVGPKTPHNIGGALRAAYAFGASAVIIEKGRANVGIRHGANTPAAHRYIPVYRVDNVFSLRPYDTQVVVVEMCDEAIDLPEFIHPPRALYLFGPEEGTLGSKHIDRAQSVVRIPSRVCLNLAAAVNVVLYDRIAKGGLE